MTRSRCAPLLLGVVLAACAGSRPRPAPLYVGWGGSLPSGLRLVVYSQVGARSFRLAACYTGGSSADPEGREGMAQLAARLASRARPAADSLQERTAAAGSRDGFEVTRMDMAFVQEGRAAALRAALEVERDRMADPLAGITEDEFLEAREALAVERGLARDVGAPDLHLSALTAHVLPGEPGARSPGTAQSVRAISLAELRAWTASQLSLRRLVLVVTSPDDVEDLVKGARAVFDPVAPGGPGVPEIAPARPAPPAPEASIPFVRETASGPVLWAAWILPGNVAADATVLEAFRSVVEGAIRGELSSSGAGPGVSSVTVHAVRLPGRALVAAGIGLRRDADAEPVARVVAAAVARAPASFSAGWTVRALGDASGRAAFLGGAEVNPVEAARWFRETGEPDYLAGHQAAALSLAQGRLPPAGVAALAAGEMRRLLILPLGPAPPEPEALGFLLAAWSPPPGRGPAPGPEAVRALLADPPPVARRTLTNGLEILAVPLGASPQVVARLVVRTPPEGTAPFPAGLGALAILAADRRPGIGRTPCGRVERIPGGEIAELQAVGTAAGLPAMLQALACVASSGSVGARFREVRDGLARTLAATSEVRGGWAETFYPDHPYGRSLRPEALRGQEEADAERWLRFALRPDRAALVIAGRFEPGPGLDRQVDAAFAAWGLPDAPPGDPPRPGPGRRRVVLLPGRIPGGLALVRVRLAAGDRAAAQALGPLLAERLRAALPREVPSGAQVTSQRQEHLLQVALVGASDIPAALERALGEVRRLAGGEVTAPEAARARWQVARAVAPRHDSAPLAAADLAAEAALGPVADEAARIESLAALSPERIAAAARGLAPGSELVLVLGSEGLLPALRAQGLEVEVARPAPR